MKKSFVTSGPGCAWYVQDASRLEISNLGSRQILTVQLIFDHVERRHSHVLNIC